jgi:hypothetical protein
VVEENKWAIAKNRSAKGVTEAFTGACLRRQFEALFRDHGFAGVLLYAKCYLLRWRRIT